MFGPELTTSLGLGLWREEGCVVRYKLLIRRPLETGLLAFLQNGRPAVPGGDDRYRRLLITHIYFVLLFIAL